MLLLYPSQHQLDGAHQLPSARALRQRRPAAPHAALTGLRVLVVEDELLIALDLGSILDRLGRVVLGPAPTVPEALRLPAADPPDAALLDMNLRGTRATPVALALALAGRGVPFAVVSAYGAAPEP